MFFGVRNMAATAPQSMPPPQAPLVMGPPSSSGIIPSPTQAMVTPQFSHNSTNYSQGTQPGMMNGTTVSGSPTGQNQPFANNLHNGLSQAPPNVSVSKMTVDSTET